MEIREAKEFIDFIREHGELAGKIKNEERYRLGKYLVEAKNNGFCVAKRGIIIYFFFEGKEVISMVSLENIFREIKNSVP